MNKPLKVMTSAAILASVAAPAAVSADVETGSIEKVAIELDGQVQVLDYADYSSAILFGDNEEAVNLVENGTVAAVSIGGGQFVDFSSFAYALTVQQSEDESVTANDVLKNLQTDESALVDQDVVDSYEEFGAPVVQTVTTVDADTVEVTFENGETVEVDLSEALVDGATTVSFEYEGNTYTDVELNEPFVQAPAIESLSAVGAKELQVEFNKSVDADTVDLTVNKGSITPSISEVTFNEDNTAATIELSGKLTEGEYTVTVNGLEEELTETVSVADEVVSEVEILSENAVTTATDASGNPTEVQVGYKVYNQYGEEITKFTTLNPAVGGVGSGVTTTATNGTLTITNLSNVEYEDQFTVTLVHPQSATSASQTVVVSKEAVVSEVSFGGLYNKDGEKLTEDSTASEFYLKVNAKDQYGNVIEDESVLDSNVLVNVSNNTIASVNGLSGDTANFEEIEINGEEQLVLQLANGTSSELRAGDTTVTLISKFTGASDSYTVTVDNGIKVDEFSFSSPQELVVEDETVRIPFQAFNLDGEEVDKASILNDLTAGDTRGVKVTASGAASGSVSFQQDYVTGESYIEVTPTTDGSLTLTAITSTNKVKTLTLNVKEKAMPTSIVKVDEEDPTNALVNESFALSYDDLQVQDQYGRTLDLDSPVFSGTVWNDGTPATKDQYRVAIVEEKVQAVDGEEGAFALDANQLTASNTDVTFEAASTKGSEEVTFKLQKYDGSTWKDVTGSDLEIDPRAVEQSELESYEVEDITQMFDEVGYGVTNDNKYDQTFEVYGLTSDNARVIMPANPSTDAQNAGVSEYYSVTTNDASVLDVQDAEEDTELDVISAANYASDESDKAYQAKVTINRTGEVINQDVIVSKDKPVVEGVFFNDTADESDESVTNGEIVEGIEQGAVYEISATTLNGANAAAELLDEVNVVDQYGKETEVAADGTVTFTSGVTTEVTSVTFSNIVEEDENEDINVNNNGKVNADLSGLDELDNFTSTFTFANGTTASLKVVVTQ